MKIRYVGPLDAVEIELPRERRLVVRRGADVDVPDVIAGRAPEAAVKACEVELVDAVARQDHEVAKRCREQWGELDHGEGLLAQVDNWQPVVAKAAKSKAAEAVEEGD